MPSLASTFLYYCVDWVSSVRLFFVTGSLGALTTYSSYAVETVHAASGGSFHVSIVNLLGLVLVVVDILLIRYLTRVLDKLFRFILYSHRLSSFKNCFIW